MLNRAGMRASEARRQREGKPLPIGVAIAHFMWCYGGGTFIGPWPTTDRVIPWTMFWHLYGAMPHVLALSRVNQAQAAALGTALASGSSQAAELSRGDVAEAYPTE